MLKDEIRNVLNERENVVDNDYYNTERVWEKEVTLLSRNIEETISFLDTECTADEFSWISEVFEDIVIKTQSREFIACLYRVAKKFPEESEKHYIVDSIEFAESYLD